jgi:hypothetical protein
VRPLCAGVGEDGSGQQAGKDDVLHLISGFLSVYR